MLFIDKIETGDHVFALRREGTPEHLWGCVGKVEALGYPVAWVEFEISDTESVKLHANVNHLAKLAHSAKNEEQALIILREKLIKAAIKLAGLLESAHDIQAALKIYEILTRNSDTKAVFDELSKVYGQITELTKEL